MPMRLFSWTPIFHGWYVVVACVVASMVIVGARNGIGAFVIPMSEDFGWSRGTVSIAAFLGIFVNGLTQPFLGNAIDRFGGRKVIVLSLVLLGLGILSLSMTTHIFFLIIIFGLVFRNGLQRRLTSDYQRSAGQVVQAQAGDSTGNQRGGRRLGRTDADSTGYLHYRGWKLAACLGGFGSDRIVCGCPSRILNHSRRTREIGTAS